MKHLWRWIHARLVRLDRMLVDRELEERRRRRQEDFGRSLEEMERRYGKKRWF